MDKKVWRKSRKKKQDCSCSKKRHGRPKVGHGICHLGQLRPTVIERRKVSRLIGRYLAGIEDEV